MATAVPMMINTSIARTVTDAFLGEPGTDLFYDLLIVFSDFFVGAIFLRCAVAMYRREVYCGTDVSIQTLVAATLARAIHLRTHWVSSHITTRHLPSIFPVIGDALALLCAVLCLAIYFTESFTNNISMDLFGYEFATKMDKILFNGKIGTKNAGQIFLRFGPYYVVVIFVAIMINCLTGGVAPGSNNPFIALLEESLWTTSIIPQVYMTYRRGFYISNTLGELFLGFVAQRVLIFILMSLVADLYDSYAYVHTSVVKRQMLEFVNLAILLPFAFWHIYERCSKTPKYTNSSRIEKSSKTMQFLFGGTDGTLKFMAHASLPMR